MVGLWITDLSSSSTTVASTQKPITLTRVWTVDVTNTGLVLLHSLFLILVASFTLLFFFLTLIINQSCFALSVEKCQGRCNWQLRRCPCQWWECFEKGYCRSASERCHWRWWQGLPIIWICEFLIGITYSNTKIMVNYKWFDN